MTWTNNKVLVSNDHKCLATLVFHFITPLAFEKFESISDLKWSAFLLRNIGSSYYSFNIGKCVFDVNCDVTYHYYYPAAKIVVKCIV